MQAIRAGAGQLRKGRDQMLQRYLADVLLQLASDASALEIEQTSKDVKIFDRASNINIYYIDGKKHGSGFRRPHELERGSRPTGLAGRLPTRDRDARRCSRRIHPFSLLPRKEN